MNFLPAPLRLTVLLGASVLAAPAFSAPSEAGRPLSRVFLPEDYHGFEQVWDFAQTRDGLLYATNYGALREFDGREWRTISLPTSFVFKVAAAPDDRLYIAGFDEIGYVDRTPEGGRRYYSLIDRLPKGEPPLAQVQSCLSYGGAIWWNSSDRVLRWDGRTMKLWRFEAPLRLKMHATPSALYVDEGGKALHRFNASSEQFEVVSDDKALATLALGIFDNWGDQRHVAVRGNGSLVGFDDHGKSEKLVSESELPQLAHRVTSSTRLHDGRLAIATQGYGVFLVSPQGNQVQLQFGTKGGVASPEFYGVFEDREHGLWLGSSLGLARVDPSLEVTVFDKDNGGPAGVSYSVFRFKGDLYSRGDDGLYRMIPANSPLESARFEKVPAPTFKSNEFAENPHGLLIASDLGLLRFDGEKVITEFQTAHSLHYVFAPKGTPGLVFYSDSWSLRMARWDGSRWSDAGAIPSTDMDVRSMAEDERGDLWLGSPVRGVFRLRHPAAPERWDQATLESFGHEQGLPLGHEWTTVRSTPLGVMFVHSKGVSVYDSATGKLTSAGAFDAVGRNGRYLYAFAAAPEGTCWVQLGDPTRGEKAEIGGVAPVAGGGWKWVNLPQKVADALGYLGAQEINWEPGAGGRGVLWLAGQKNLVRVDLNEALTETKAPVATVLLRDVSLGETRTLPVTPTDGGLSLAFTRDPLRFHFVSPLFGTTEAPQFQFRLLGFNQEWSPWSTRNEAVYTNLQRGDFVFQVRARTQGGEPGESVEWRFTVSPPWWNSTWAYLGYAFSLTAFVYGVFRWRLSLETRARERLEKEVAQRTQELDHAKSRAEEASQAKTMFLARMSHELRTPLHAILGYSRMLAEDAALPAPARERLRIVKASGQHLLKLINEVLDLSKIEAGKQELRIETFDLALLVEEVCDAQAARATLKHLSFQRPVLATNPQVLGDPSKLRQVLENLLGNATKFTQSGTVALEVTQVNEAAALWKFSVRDTGPGLSPEDSARLFQPFSQAGPGERHEEKGTGLGLVISQRLISLMGGRLWVDSVRGQGATFSFEIVLRRSSAPLRATKVSRRKEGYEGPRRFVLAVDDVEANRQLFIDLLGPLGFEVSVASSAEEALEKLALRRPDLLLLDLRLPGMDGLELARRARRMPALDGMKILAASASVLGHDPREALAAGCDGFIPKPFLEHEFLEKVGELLGIVWVDTPVPALAPTEASLSPDLLLALREAAVAGDVVAIRQVLEKLRAQAPVSERLSQLETAMQAFDTERVAKLAAEGMVGGAP